MFMFTFFNAGNIDGFPKVQSLAVRVEGAATEPQVVVCLIFIIANPARSFFRSVEQMLPAARCRMVSAAEAPKVSHVGLGQLGIISMVWTDTVLCGVKRR